MFSGQWTIIQSGIEDSGRSGREGDCAVGSIHFGRKPIHVEVADNQRLPNLGCTSESTRTRCSKRRVVARVISIGQAGVQNARLGINRRISVLSSVGAVPYAVAIQV